MDKLYESETNEIENPKNDFWNARLSKTSNLKTNKTIYINNQCKMGWHKRRVKSAYRANPQASFLYIRDNPREHQYSVKYE